MDDFVFYSLIFLWAGFTALVVINVALLRQFGVLFERVAPAGALSMNAQLQAGQAAPEISLTSLSGEKLMIGHDPEAKQKTLLFFASPSCAVCKTLLPVIKRFDQSQKQLRVIYASAGEDIQLHEDFIAKQKLPREQYVISDQLGMVYGVSKLPYAFLIDENAKIISMGLVNTREHVESLFEADIHKVASLQEYLNDAEENQIREQKDAG